MAFDPSVIASIGDNAPDLTAAKAKAYSLADMIDQNQLNKGKLADDKQNRDDQAKVRQVLQSSDLSTYEGKLKAGEQITKINPKMGMDFVKETTSAKGQQNELTQQQYQILSAKNDIIGSAAFTLKQQHDQLASSGKNEAEINAAMMPQMMQTLKQLESQTLPDGTPLLNAQDRQNYEQTLGKGYNPAVIDGIVMRSKQAGDALKLKLAERKENTSEATQAERDRHDRATEENQRDNTEIRRKKAEEAHSQFQGANGDLMASLALKGISLPAGFRSKEQQVALLDSLRAKFPNDSAEDISEKVRVGQIDLAAVKKETQVAATQVGKVELAGNEIGEFGDQVLQASKAVPRGNLVPWSKLKQMADTEISDPALLRFKTKMQALNSAYDQLSARGGTDKDKRAHIHELFDSAQGQDSVEALVKALKEEAEGADRAARKTMKVKGTGDVADQNTPAKGAAPAGAPPPPPGFVVQ
jgi:hypothetical protein